MTESSSLREEINEIIEKLPDCALYSLYPFLKSLANDTDEELSDEDPALFLENEKAREERP